MDSKTYVYARNRKTGAVSITEKSSLNSELYEQLYDVPNYETLNEVIDESNRLHIENEHLEERIEQAESRFDKELEEFWLLLLKLIRLDKTCSS